MHTIMRLRQGVVAVVDREGGGVCVYAVNVGVTLQPWVLHVLSFAYAGLVPHFPCATRAMRMGGRRKSLL